MLRSRSSLFICSTGLETGCKPVLFLSNRRCRFGALTQLKISFLIEAAFH